MVKLPMLHLLRKQLSAVIARKLDVLSSTAIVLPLVKFAAQNATVMAAPTLKRMKNANPQLNL